MVLAATMAEEMNESSLMHRYKKVLKEPIGKGGMGKVQTLVAACVSLFSRFARRCSSAPPSRTATFAPSRRSNSTAETPQQVHWQSRRHMFRCDAHAAAVDAVFNEIDLLRRFKGNPYMCVTSLLCFGAVVMMRRSVSMEDYEEAGRDTVR